MSLSKNKFWMCPKNWLSCISPLSLSYYFFSLSLSLSPHVCSYSFMCSYQSDGRSISCVEWRKSLDRVNFHIYLSSLDKSISPKHKSISQTLIYQSVSQSFVSFVLRLSLFRSFFSVWLKWPTNVFTLESWKKSSSLLRNVLWHIFRNCFLISFAKRFWLVSFGYLCLCYPLPGFELRTSWSWVHSFDP